MAVLLALLATGVLGGTAPSVPDAAAAAPVPDAAPAVSPVPSAPARAPDPSPAAPSAPAAASPQAPERGMALTVPALGLTTTVGEISPADGVIDPPAFDRAYRIAPYGAPGSDNTTYIAGHSWDSGDAVFNPLLDVGTQEATMAEGDAVEVVQDGETFRYEVTDVRRHPKGSLAEVEEVWRKVPGRLVLITCFQRNDGARSRDNLVVTAELVGTGPVPADG